jgi:hypothetical protein
VNATEGEVDHVLVRGRDPAARRLGGDGGLVGHLVQEVRLGQLGLGKGSGHLEERLVGEHQPALGDRPHVSRESQVPEQVERLVRVAVRRPKVLEVLVGEAKRLQEVEAVLQPAGDQEAPPVGKIPHEEAERGRGGHTPPEVTGGHVQLVEVGEQRASHRRSLGSAEA